MTCPACGSDMYPEQFGIGYCVNGNCRCWAELQDNGRWLIHLPSSVVPTSDWIDCPVCGGTRDGGCEIPWCADPDHGGPCRNCRTLGVVRGTLDHPTTHPPQETP